MLFEWDESKWQVNLEKHHLDFREAKHIFDGPVFERTEARHGEERVVAVGIIDGVEIVVVYVMRGTRRRIISARRADRHERANYQNHVAGADEGKDRP